MLPPIHIWMEYWILENNLFIHIHIWWYMIIFLVSWIQFQGHSNNFVEDSPIIHIYIEWHMIVFVIPKMQSRRQNNNLYLAVVLVTHNSTTLKNVTKLKYGYCCQYTFEWISDNSPIIHIFIQWYMIVFTSKGRFIIIGCVVIALVIVNSLIIW